MAHGSNDAAMLTDAESELLQRCIDGKVPHDGMPTSKIDGIKVGRSGRVVEDRSADRAT